MGPPDCHLRICNCAVHIDFLGLGCWRDAHFHFDRLWNVFLEVELPQSQVSCRWWASSISLPPVSAWRSSPSPTATTRLPPGLSWHFVGLSRSAACISDRVSVPSRRMRWVLYVVFRILVGNGSFSHHRWGAAVSIENHSRELGSGPGRYLGLYFVGQFRPAGLILMIGFGLFPQVSTFNLATCFGYSCRTVLLSCSAISVA